MDISVVIVSYNTQELLEKCLTSLTKSLKNLKSEIFVIDNNSLDESAGMVRKKFPRVNLIANKQNRGFAKANNQALTKVKGKYILILNPDTQIMPDTVAKMIEYMNNSSKVAVATCRVELPNGTLDKDCRRLFPTPWRSFTHFSGLSGLFKGSGLFDQYYMGNISDKKEHEIDSCVGAFMIVRKNAMDKIGLFDEDFFFYGEDLDWCWRFKEKGYKVFYTPVTKIIHYKGAASGMKASSKHVTKATKESKKRALYESVHAMEIFYKKHYIDKYPFFINAIVLTSLKILEKIRVLSA